MEAGTRTSSRGCALILVALSLLAGCASQPRPLSLRSTQAIVDAKMNGIPWNLTAPVDGRPPRVLVVLFDGTRNDREQVGDDERRTIIAHIGARLKENPKHSPAFTYTPGTGTRGNGIVRLLDSATGASAAKRAKVACEEALEEIRQIREQQADADIRVLVSGFSRGAASARHFLNLLERGCRKGDPAHDPGIRSYALLFDTVATGQRKKLLLGIPASTDSVLHLVSMDERRIFFRPDLDDPPNDLRIRTIPLPGVHSDVGDSYLEGVGGEVRQYVDALLARMGLIDARTDDLPIDYSIQGTNDSRWLLEKMLLIPVAGTSRDAGRNPYSADAAPLWGDRQFEWHVRYAEIGEAPPLGFSRSTYSDRPAFLVKRLGTTFKLEAIALNLSPWPVPGLGRWAESGVYFAPTLTPCGDTLALRYEVLGGSPHMYLLPERIADRVRTQETTLLEIGVLAREAGNKIRWFVDDIDAGKSRGGPVSMHAGTSIQCPPAGARHRDADAKVEQHDARSAR